MQKWFSNKKEVFLQRKELKEVWLKHVRNKMAEEGKKVWNEKNLSNEIMHEWLNTHIRTPYK